MHKIYNTEIIANSPVAKDHNLLSIKSRELAMNSQPGQFVMVRVLEHSTDPLLRIPLSIHSIDENGIGLLYRVIGNATKILSEKKTADFINIFGPLGNGFKLARLDPAENKECFLVGGGTAVAPLYALAQALCAKNIKPTLFIGARNSEQLLCVEKFAPFANNIYTATEDGSQGFHGSVAKLCADYFKSIDTMPAIVYASGPNRMLEALAKILHEFKIPGQFAMESYMACGIGVCKGCAVKTPQGYKLCCKDGPVFNY